MKRKKNKKNKSFILKMLICIFIIGICIISSYDNISKIRTKNREKNDLIIRLKKLQDDQKILADDVEKLQNPEYAARYAREKYFYSKNGEKILKID